MERIEGLGRYQKGILLLLVAMAAVFLVIYWAVSSRVGFLYRDTILIPVEENGSTVYTGTVQKRECRITVTAEKAITLRWGNRVYGPYTVTEDPSAVPLNNDFPLKGIEIREGNQIFFRGGILETGSQRMLFHESGEFYQSITVTASGGTVTDGDGNEIDPMEPSVYTILELASGPALERKGHWGIWFLALFLSAVIAVSICFADELFRMKLSFRVADPYWLEPSDLEIFGRYFGWTVATVAVLVLYITGLR